MALNCRGRQLIGGRQKVMLLARTTAGAAAVATFAAGAIGVGGVAWVPTQLPALRRPVGDGAVAASAGLGAVPSGCSRTLSGMAAVAGGVAAALTTSALASGVLARSRRAGRSRRRSQPMGVSIPSQQVENYMVILIEKPDGQRFQVEAKPSDSIRTVKVMIQVEIGVAEDQQELALEGCQLSDTMKVSECGINEGTCLNLTITEGLSAESSDEDAAAETPVAEGELRVYVSCTNGSSKKQRIMLDIPKEEKGEALKIMAYKHFCDSLEHIKNLSKDDYGLFLVKGEWEGPKGPIRVLTRDERVKERLPVENGLSGGEELVFASLIYYEL
eukprot:CAMPEP_0117546522 /NCGR_PEP_ID=MMETSP0784-20121206/46649_1 /TAXON_ID=39447 /ORGANISM="" /LENGTH=329 /DNA_ID=CAMNT_0005343393 /DNA_START=33 /DNA_END=1022 /DNA_ORIENTATION=+